MGVHKTGNLDDGYMGSGEHLGNAIKKYGIENFTRTILEWFEDSKSMYGREKEVVSAEFLLREDVYNIKLGGCGGWDYVNKSGLGKKGGISCAKNKKGFHSTESHEKSIKTNRTNAAGLYDTKIRSLGVAAALAQEAKEKRKETLTKIGHAQGKKNSQYGMMWITNEQQSMKIKNIDPIPKGWRKGRIMNSR